MDKQERKAAAKRWKDAEREGVLAGMPLSPEQLHRLLAYLDSHLDSCDHGTPLTARFLKRESLDLDAVLAWLGEQGGFCDCEVLANLADLDESLQAPAPQPAPRIERRPQQARAARPLANLTGWDLSKLPARWRIANLYAPAEPIRLELGKKGACSVAIVEAQLPAGDQAADEYWSRLWYDRTELSAKGPLQVTREVVAVPAGFTSTLVRTPSWIPVYCWIVPRHRAWFLEVRSESNRYTQDLPHVAALISSLAR